jgi:hypothetical protein
MTQDLQEIEREIEQSRAKLDNTIDQLQDKMSVSGVVDDMLGSARSGPYAPLFDNVLETVKRNPVPVMLITMGLGLLAYRLARPSREAYRTTRLIAADEDFITEEDFVAEIDEVRVYDERATPLEPVDDMFENRRTMNSRI